MIRSDIEDRPAMENDPRNTTNQLCWCEFDVFSWIVLV